jgi:hypothetical protein
MVSAPPDEQAPGLEPDEDEPPLETPEPVASDPPPRPVFMPYLRGHQRLQAQRDLAQWVHQLLVPVYVREVTSTALWCDQWWLHPEAVMQLHGLQMAWNQLTGPGGGPTGPAMWHRDFLGPLLTALRSPAGPFAGCKPGRHRDSPPYQPRNPPGIPPPGTPADHRR